KLPIIIMFVFVLTLPTSEAHLLWGSYAECVTTLGEPQCVPSDIPPATEACSWRNGAWGTMIHFWDRRAHWISSLKLDGTVVSPSELQATLDAFADGNSWVQVAADKYRRSDRKVTVRLKGDL